MKTYFSDLLPKIQRFSNKLDNLTLLTNQHWVSIDEIVYSKKIYIFKSNNILLISNDGNVEKASWEFLGNNSILIENNKGSFLFKHAFFDENVLALKIDSESEYAFFVNENKYEGELDSLINILEFLKRTYLDTNLRNVISNSTDKFLNHDNNNYTKYKRTIDGLILKIVSENRETIGAQVYINDKNANDGIYIFKSLSHKIIIKDGKICKRYYLETYKNFIFEKENNGVPTIGDKVYYSNWNIVNDNIIWYSIFKKIIVKNGIIVK